MNVFTKKIKDFCEKIQKMDTTYSTFITLKKLMRKL